MKPQGGGCHAVDVGSGHRRRLPVAHGKHLSHLPGEDPGEVKNVRGLLYHRSAGPVPDRPPPDRGYFVQPRAADQAHRAPVEQPPGTFHHLQIAPMVTDGGQYARRGDPGAHPLGRLCRRGQRLLHEQWYPRGQDSGLGRPVRERRHADIYRVESGGKQLAGAGERPASDVPGQRRRRFRDHVGNPGEVNVRETTEHLGVAAAHVPGTDQPDPADIHRPRFSR